MKANLAILYDNPTPPSDIYLKYIKKTAEEKNVDIHLFEDAKEFQHFYLSEECDGGIVLLPSNHPKLHLDIIFSKNAQKDVDGISSKSIHKSATAMGIFKCIKEHYFREAIITVIGRGTVGSILTYKLIEEGYTVISINSRTPRPDMIALVNRSSVVVGLSSQDNILTDDDITNVFWPITFIDAGHNFSFKSNTHKVLKCGKWTREVLFDRILHNFGNRAPLEELVEDENA